jgi:HK97 family phage portal protein
MNFFQRLFPVLKDSQTIVAPKALYTESVSKKINHMNSMSVAPTSLDSFDIKKAELVSTIYTCINILASNISRAPLCIYKDDGTKKVLAKDHPYFIQLRYKPQSFYSYQNWISLIVSHLHFYGNAYALITKNELTIIHPDLVDVAHGGGEIWYLIEGMKTPIPSRDVLHFKLLSKDGVRGISPISSLRSEIQLMVKAEKTVEKFFDNRGSSLYLQPIEGVGALDKTKISELLDTWAEIKNGIDSKGIFVCPPLMQIKELKLTADEIGFLSTAAVSEASICSLYGIPIFLMGKSNSNYTNFEQQQLNFKNQVLGSLFNIIRAELENKLLKTEEKLDNYTIEFDLKSFLETDLATKSAYLKTLHSVAALSPNEIRREFNLAPIENEHMDAHYQQAQYIQVEKLGENQNSNPVTYLNNTN